MIVTKTFRYRLEPNALQRQAFACFAGCCRFVFNQGLAARKASYETDGRTLSYADQCKQLSMLKREEETAWLSEVHSQVLQQALKDLDAAYQHFFRRVKAGEVTGFPKFKKKGQKDSFRYPQGVKVKDGRAYLPKIGWVKYRDSRAVEGEILQTTIKREGKHWFISLACEAEVPDPTPVPVSEERAVGIDVGLKSFAVLSDGSAIENPRFKNHDVIAVEDLHIKGMVRNRHLSLAISDVGWGQFIEMLEYKAKWAGKHFVRIGRFEATSKTCSNCGEKKAMPLSVRTYVCDGCGMEMDRDWNASVNIRAAGLVVRNACGGA